MPIRAALVHTYCLRDDGIHLTSMSGESVTVAARLYKESRVQYILLSAAYDIWRAEAAIKIVRLISLGVPKDCIFVLEGVTDSYDEVNKAKVKIKELGINELTIVAEKYHAPRAFAIARKRFPGMKLNLEEFNTPQFERAFEPHRIKLLGWIKSVRAGNKTLWRLWNFLLLFAPK